MEERERETRAWAWGGKIIKKQNFLRRTYVQLSRRGLGMRVGGPKGPLSGGPPLFSDVGPHLLGTRKAGGPPTKFSPNQTKKQKKKMKKQPPVSLYYQSFFLSAPPTDGSYGLVAPPATLSLDIE